VPHKLPAATPRPILFAVALLIALAGGCARQVSMKTWQKDVEQYVRKNGNDPAVLRDVTLADGQGGRRGFGAIGKNDVRKSTDANGVLVAHETAAGRPWFVYLVGVVDKQKVKEIRLAALSMLDGQPTWRIGPEDADALERYRDYGLSQWKQQPHDKDARPPADYTTFPRPSDRFDAAVEGNYVRVKHQGSEAQWEVDLAGK
jgi:hypothetical protein